MTSSSSSSSSINSTPTTFATKLQAISQGWNGKKTESIPKKSSNTHWVFIACIVGGVVLGTPIITIGISGLLPQHISFIASSIGHLGQVKSLIILASGWGLTLLLITIGIFGLFILWYRSSSTTKKTDIEVNSKDFASTTEYVQSSKSSKLLKTPYIIKNQEETDEIKITHKDFAPYVTSNTYLIVRQNKDKYLVIINKNSSLDVYYDLSKKSLTKKINKFESSLILENEDLIGTVLLSKMNAGTYYTYQRFDDNDKYIIVGKSDTYEHNLPRISSENLCGTLELFTRNGYIYANIKIKKN